MAQQQQQQVLLLLLLASLLAAEAPVVPQASLLRAHRSGFGG
jgi:hypothetical protein